MYLIVIIVIAIYSKFYQVLSSKLCGVLILYEELLIKSEKLSCCGYICFGAQRHFFRPNNKIYT